MKVLITGFTSRTIGSDRNVYDYVANVSLMVQAIRAAGHAVDIRALSLVDDVDPQDDYDVTLVGVAACQGLSSRYKLSGLWALHKFGKRAGIFPSDGQNVKVFPSSVLTCLSGNHHDNRDNNRKLDPVDYMLGFLQRERNNVVDAKLGFEMKDVWRDVLNRLPHSLTAPKCEWPVLVPTFPWGKSVVYQRHYGSPFATCWDPSPFALDHIRASVFNELGTDGRLLPLGERERQWVLAALQDNSKWLAKQRCAWPVLEIGNKRKAADGLGEAYIPETELFRQTYRENWGVLGFAYGAPLSGDGGWWRTRVIHAAMAGAVYVADKDDARCMPAPYDLSRALVERWSNDRLADQAGAQHEVLMQTLLSKDESASRVDTFLRSLM